MNIILMINPCLVTWSSELERALNSFFTEKALRAEIDLAVSGSLLSPAAILLTGMTDSYYNMIGSDFP